MPPGATVRVQALGVDALIVRSPSLCEAPEFVDLVLQALVRSVRPGRRLDYRDELIRALAQRYSGSKRARAVAMLRDVRRYEATRWRFDRGWAVCPKEIAGTIQGDIWYLLKVSPRFPGQRQLQNLIR